MTSIRNYAAYGYGLLAYIVAMATVAYTVGFLANVLVPKSIDAGVGLPVGDPIVVNLALIGLFGLQHSLMARQWFKNRWTRLVPEPIERSTYVLFASITLVVLMWAWKPLPDTVWMVEGPLAMILWGVYLGGWLLMFASSEMIDGADLMGLRQVRAYRDGRDVEPLDFQTPYAYRFVRNPMMVGFLVAFWATSWMSVGHLLFAGGMTAYILVGVKLEERDLISTFGERYRQYRRVVPLFVPRPWRTASRTSTDGPVPNERSRSTDPTSTTDTKGDNTTAK